MRGHVRKRGTKWAAVIDEGRVNGRRKQRWLSGYRTRKDAEKALTEALGRVDKGAFIAPTKVTVGEFLDEWLSTIRASVKPSTHDSYRRLVEGQIKPGIGSISLQGLSASDLNSFYADLLRDGRRNGNGGGLSPTTVRYCHAVIRRALSRAVKWDRVVRNVAVDAEPPKAAKTTMTTWKADEVAAFLGMVRDDPLGPAFHVAAMTGMRRGEVLALRWADLDLDAGRLSVEQSMTSVGFEIVFGTPKTGRGRVVHLDPGTVTVLREHRRRQAEARLAAGPTYTDNGFVFAQRDGSPTHPDTFSKTFERIVRDNDLPRIRPHDLRHTWATLALRAGIHPKVVSEQLGHATISITLDTYSHAIPSMQEDAAERVARLIFGEAR